MYWKIKINKRRILIYFLFLQFLLSFLTFFRRYWVTLLVSQFNIFWYSRFRWLLFIIQHVTTTNGCLCTTSRPMSKAFLRYGGHCREPYQLWVITLAFMIGISWT